MAGSQVGISSSVLAHLRPVICLSGSSTRLWIESPAINMASLRQNASDDEADQDASDNEPVFSDIEEEEVRA